MINISNASRETLTRVLGPCPEHYRPIVTAVRDYGCGYAMVLQDAGPFNLPLTLFKPAIVVIGDDLHTSKGPAAFHAASVEKLIRQCEAAFVIASAAVTQTYIAACYGPVQLRKHVVIVETQPDQEAAWSDLIWDIKPDIRMVISKVDPTARSETPIVARA